MTISSERLAMLNSGQDASNNLTEGLAVDFAVLMAAAVPQAGAATQNRMRQAATLGVSKRMALAGAIVLDAVGVQGLNLLAQHRSDTVRGWVCYALAQDYALRQPGEPLQSLLEAVRPLADDAHFGVREWVWLAVRPHIAAQTQQAISYLAGWATAPSERVRRFASESTRPRGVWCTHIGILKENPSLGLPVLEPLKADSSRYVQDSVGNWLNDAAKSQPQWVRGLCHDWLAQSPCKATAYICKRAQRSLAGK